MKLSIHMVFNKVKITDKKYSNTDHNHIESLSIANAQICTPIRHAK